MRVLGIAGWSGSGKTTLLLTLGGMLKPTKGNVLIGEDDLYALPSGARALARKALQPAARGGGLAFRTHPIEAGRDPRALAHFGEPGQLARCPKIAFQLGLARCKRAPVDHTRRDFGDERLPDRRRPGGRGIDTKQRSPLLCAQGAENVRIPARGQIGGIADTLVIYFDARWEIRTELRGVGPLPSDRNACADIGQTLGPGAIGPGARLLDPRQRFAKRGRSGQRLCRKTVESGIVPWQQGRERSGLVRRRRVKLVRG